MIYKTFKKTLQMIRKKINLFQNNDKKSWRNVFNEYFKWFFNTPFFSNDNYIIVTKQINDFYEFFYELWMHWNIYNY